MMECGSCRDCLHKLCAHKIPVFASLNREEMAHLSSIARHRNYGKGENLVSEGDPLDALVILNEGDAKAYQLTPDGHEQILYVFSQGDFFGERNLLGNRTSPYTVTALKPVKTCIFGRDAFHDMLRANPEIAVKIIEELESRMERMENALQNMGVRNLDERIGGLLLDFSEKYGAKVPEGILLRLPLSREGIARYLGVARETVSRKLGQLEKDGVIRSVSNKSILILNGEALKTAVGKEN
ncbi:MAG: Crp/Fnr family transcriptional regulator [Oscillospiraceae bacterium]|jgi:CRP/FNR family transcriptional regulator|nr:Crp/Fnr family transcriptional regulator [Oscillospiraceae bacterium]